MPRLRKLKLAPLADLLAQLRYAPRETRLRQMRSAEALAEEITPGQDYPHDYIVFRLTGYRPDRSEHSDTIYAGETILADLAVLVERLSDSLNLTSEELGESCLTMPQLQAHWSVSERTINRYRRSGLIGHRVVIDGQPRLVFTQAQINRFAALRAEQLERAGAFSRLDADVEKRVLARARRYRERLGLSLNQAAERLAGRFQRGQETIRQLLLRHDEGAGDLAIFRDAGPLEATQRRAIHRAWRRGLPIEALCRRYGRSRSSIHRTINEQRALLLRTLDLRGPTAATFAREDADSVILAPEAVWQGLDLAPPTSLELLLQHAAQRDLPDADAEQALCAALHFLRFDAARSIDALPQHQPPATELDRIETSLRWASRLKLALVISHLRLAVQTIERYIERELYQLPADTVPELYELSVRALCEAVRMHDPFKGGRLAAPAGLRLTKLLALSGARPSDTLALARTDPAEIILPDVRPRLDTWQSWLELPGFAPARMHRLDAMQREVLLRRYGPTAHLPRTIAQAAADLDMTPQRLIRLERGAIRALYEK